MKTIAQIAQEIGVTRQAVYKKIKQEPLSTNLREYTSTVDNTIYIDVDGQALIKTAFDKNSVTTELSESVNEIVNQFTASLQEEIRFLRGQNEELRKENGKLTDKVLEQSERLLSLTEQAQKLAENAQTLHALENVKPQLTEAKKQTFFKRIFSRSDRH